MHQVPHRSSAAETIAAPQASSKSLARLKARRKVWLEVHLWLGLLLGLFLSIFGLTGSVLVFHAEINEWLNPKLLTVTVPETNRTYKPLAEIFLAGRLGMPDQAKLTFADYPRNAKAAFKLHYSVPASENITEDWQIYVNPYTAQATGKQLMNSSDSLFPKTFIGIVFELHYALFLGEEVGYKTVAAMGTLLIISVLTGLIVWWPLTSQWLKALTVKRKASAERLNFDLHKTFGFYSTAVLIPVLFSGVYMDAPEHVVPVLELFSPVTYRYWFRSTPAPNVKPITMAEAVEIAERRYPTGRPDWLYGLSSPTGTYTVCKDGVQESGSLIHRRCIVIDPYSGAILDVDNPADRKATAGEVFTHWQWPLHSGQAFGWTGRILVFLSGLACPVLFVTGFIRWRQKQRGRRKKRTV
jgi:uncharacterized iron-regulated membrane protein